MRHRLWAVRSRGATAVDYGLMIALIAAVAVAVIVVVGTQTSGLFRSAPSF
jgi:pilus assembly protein Flp/PilA